MSTEIPDARLLPRSSRSPRWLLPQKIVAVRNANNPYSFCVALGPVSTPRNNERGAAAVISRNDGHPGAPVSRVEPYREERSGQTLHCLRFIAVNPSRNVSVRRDRDRRGHRHGQHAITTR